MTHPFLDKLINIIIYNYNYIIIITITITITITKKTKFYFDFIVYIERKDNGFVLLSSLIVLGRRGQMTTIIFSSFFYSFTFS
jgi:hypothetical protein